MTTAKPKASPYFREVAPRIAKCFKTTSEAERLYCLHALHQELGDPFTPQVLTEIYLNFDKRPAEVVRREVAMAA